MIEQLAAFHFLRPWWLVLLVPALTLWWLQRRAVDTTMRWRAAIDPALLKHLIVGGESRRRVTPGDLLLAGWLIGIVAIAGPAWRQMPSPFAPAAAPAMLVLKVAPSMLASDLAPTRLDRARQKMADLLGLREGASTGLIAYAGSAHLVLPPTPDRDVVLTMAQALAPDLMPREGDRLDEAIALARRVLANSGQGGSIVVLTDTAPPDQIAALDPSVIVLAMEPVEDAAWQAAQVEIVPVSVDTSDVAGIARTMARQGVAPAQGEAVRWVEAGYWLTPLIALLLLGWFRRGWVLA